jgi:hypothetical protein
VRGPAADRTGELGGCEIGKPDFAVLSDMGLLAVTGGVERDLEEFDALFAASGWRRGKTCPVGGGYFGIELSAA